MSTHATAAELEYLRTAPAAPFSRPPRFRRFRRNAPLPPTPDVVIPADPSEENGSEETWREYAGFDPREHPNRKREKVKKLWKKVSDDSEGVKEFFIFAGKGLMQMGLVWGSAFFLFRVPQHGPNKQSW